MTATPTTISTHALDVGERRYVVMPYAFDTNDMQFQNTNRFRGAAISLTMCSIAYAWLHREGAMRAEDDVD